MRHVDQVRVGRPRFGVDCRRALDWRDEPCGEMRGRTRAGLARTGLSGRTALTWADLYRVVDSAWGVGTSTGVSGCTGVMRLGLSGRCDEGGFEQSG